MSDASFADPHLARIRIRLAHRAASELRRGVPVVIDGDAPLVITAAETAGPDALAELEALSGTRPNLLLAPPRAAAILRAPITAQSDSVAVVLPDSLYRVDVCQAFADPTAEQPRSLEVLQPVAAPPAADAALGLAKLGRLLPAVLAAPLKQQANGLIRIHQEDIVSYAAHEVAGLRQIVSAQVPLQDAEDSRVVAFRSDGSAFEHLAIVVGQPESHDAPLVRIHSECFTGDLLGSMRCDCGEQLRGAIQRMAQDGAGVLLYLAQEGRGIGLVNKLRAYRLQDRGLDTMDANRVLGWAADERNFMVGATMLRLMGIHRIRLLTNNPDKLNGMAACGIDVVGREPHTMPPNGINDEYLATKAARFGHMLD